MKNSVGGVGRGNAVDAAKCGGNAGVMGGKWEPMRPGDREAGLGLWAVSNWGRIFWPWAGGTGVWVYGYQEKQTAAHGRDFGY